MSLKDMISKPADKPPVITLFGEAGMGKTTLAATFPNPIFIRAEDGLQAIPQGERPDALDLIEKRGDLFDQLRALIKEDHDYQTVVIDSVTKLDSRFEQYVMELSEEASGEKPKSINQAMGGYGAGWNAVAGQHRLVRDACERLRNKGMTIVFIAHAETESYDPPDGDGYQKYTLRINKKCVAPYIDDSDVVAFLKLKSYVKDDKKALSDGSIELICHAVAANVSKNRYGITSSMTVKQGENPLMKHIPFFSATTTATPKPTQTANTGAEQ